MNMQQTYTFFIASSWSDAAISKHFKALAKYLVERGHRVVYLTYGKQVRIDEGDFQVYSFPSPRPTRIRDFIFLHNLVRQYKPDCMIANFSAVNVMTITGWLNRVSCRINWYHTLTSQILLDTKKPLWVNSVFRLRKRLAYMLSSHIIVNSNQTRHDIINYYKVREEKTNILFYSMIDPVKIYGYSGDKIFNFITCPGRLNHSKGQDVLIKALSILRKENIILKIVFVGSGSDSNRYKLMADQLGVSGQCDFIGSVPHREMFDYMAKSQCTIVPSRNEAFGLVNIESMSVGTPVIASAVGGIPEIIRDGVDGFLVPPDDPEVLAEKIKILLTNSELRETMGANARQRFLDVFEQDKNIEKQVLWFENLVQSR